MCEQRKKQAQKHYPKKTEVPQPKKTPTKSLGDPQKYAGHFECLWHDPLSEMLKTPADTLCRRCFSNISRHQVVLIGQLMVRQELIDRHMETIDEKVKAIDEYTMDHILKEKRGKDESHTLAALRRP